MKLKKLFTALGLAAITLSMAAEGPADALNLRHTDKKRSAEANSEANIEKKECFKRLISMKKKPSTRAEEPTIEGFWLFYLGDLYFGDESIGYYTQEFEATLIDGTVTFANLNNYETPIKADYDETTQQLTFDFRYVTSTPANLYQVYIYQDPFFYNEETDEEIYGPQTATFVPEDGGYLEFDQIMGIEWIAFGDEDASDESFLGTVDMLDIAVCMKWDYEEPDDSSLWKDVGNAKLMDGWLLPAFGIDQTLEENQYLVPLQQNVNIPTYFRLLDPYKTGPAAQYNQSQRTGYIEMDLTNPDVVIINPFYMEAGFQNKDLNISRFLCYNQFMYYYLRYGVPPEYLIDIFPELPITTFKDGIVTMGSGYDATKKLVYDANYGTQDFFFGGGAWYNSAGQPLNMDAKIYFPEALGGVESIIDNTNVPAKYYNLQGVEIKEPVAGSIVIEKRGNSSRKILVR